MDLIRKMLTGEIEMVVFIAEMNANHSLQKQLHQLIPLAAIDNPAHSLWKSISYYALKISEFDLLKHLLRICRLDGTIEDNLNIFGSIQTVYTHIYPDIICTNQYLEMHDLYLDVAADCFDGPEVNHFLEKIIKDAYTEKTKKRRILRAKKAVHSCFHYENKNRPRWVQGAEWPTGINSPMKFVSQKRHNEVVNFYFLDVDTGEKKVIQQYY